MSFPDRLQMLIDARGLSQSEVARITGWSQPMVHSWCRGKNTPDIHQARALAVALRVTIDDLIRGDGLTVPEMDRRAQCWEMMGKLGAEESHDRLLRLPPVSPPADGLGVRPGPPLRPSGTVPRRRKA